MNAECPFDVVTIMTHANDVDRLVRVADVMFAHWTTLTIREYPRLTVAMRETAFAVAFDRLARELQKGTIDADSFGRQADRYVLAALCRRAQRERSRGRCTNGRQDGGWLPSSVQGTSATPAILIARLRSTSTQPHSAETTDVVEAFRQTWERKAARSFSELRVPAREDAIHAALARLTLPITTAGLTPANLPARARAIAVEALSRATKTQRKSLNREVFVDDDMLARMPSPHGDPSHDYEIRGTTRASRHIVEETLKSESWLRDVMEKKPIADVAKAIGKKATWVSQNWSRVRRAVKDIWQLIDRGTLTSERAREILSLHRVLARIREPILRAVDEVLSSGVLKVLLPAAWLGRLERLRERLQRPISGDDADRTGTS